MNTPAHLIFGITAFGRAGKRWTTTAAFLGSLAPDLSLYAMVGWSIYVKGVPPRTVFREYYYSPEWQQVFAVDNSFVLWGLLLVIALWLKRAWLVAFTGAGLLHLCLDFPVHNHDARMHFWPLTDWVFVSPVSYWDTRHFAGIIQPMELIAAMICCVILFWRFKKISSRASIAILAGCELLASGFFRWFF